MVARRRHLFPEKLETRHLLCGANPTVAFSQESYDVSENGSAIGPEITLIRSCDEGEATVELFSTVGPALASDVVGYGSYGSRRHFEVTFDDGAISKTVAIEAMPKEQLVDLLRWASESPESFTDLNAAVTLVDDGLFEPTKTMSLRIKRTGTVLAPEGQISTVLNIVDDDPKSVVLSHTDGTTDIMVSGAVDTVATSLNYRPSGNVVVTPSYGESVVLVTPPQLEFSRFDWNKEKLFRVQGLRATDMAQLTVSIDVEQTNEADLNTESALFEFSVAPSVQFEQVSDGLSVADVHVDPITTGLNPSRFTVVGDYLFFVSAAEDTQDFSLWKSDGTTDGTVRVAELEGLPSMMAGNEGQLFYLIGSELWSLGDGDQPESLGPDNGRIAELEELAEANEDSASGAVTTRRSFRFNGRSFGLIGFRQLSRILNARHIPIVDYFVEEDSSAFALFEDRFYFVASTENTGSELWISDGTQPGTRPVADLRAGAASGLNSIVDSAVFRGELYFAANDGVSGWELWKTDGDGISQVFDFEGQPTSGDVEGSNAKRLTKVNDSVYFVADNGSTSQLQLWATKALSDTASMLVAIPQPETTAHPANLLRRILSYDLVALIPYQDELLFTHNYWYDNGFDASYPVSEFELWKSDGTAIGTELILPAYQDYFDVPWDLNFVCPKSSAIDASGRLFFEGATYDGTQAASSSEFEPWLSRKGDNQFKRVGDQMFFNNRGRLFVSTDGLATSIPVSPKDAGRLYRPAMIRQSHTSRVR